jgi:hypothetical protein
VRRPRATWITLICATCLASFSSSIWTDPANPSIKVTRANIAQILSFEVPQTGGFPTGWQGGNNSKDVAVVRDVVHSGEWAARIERDMHSPDAFSGFNVSIPIDFKGSKIELRGFLRTQSVDGFAGLWMREDGNASSREFKNMSDQKLNGTTDWNEYAIDLPLNPEARRVLVGASLGGSGTVWIDDLQLLVDGKPVADLEGACCEGSAIRQRRHRTMGHGVRKGRSLPEMHPIEGQRCSARFRSDMDLRQKAAGNLAQFKTQTDL